MHLIRIYTHVLYASVQFNYEWTSLTPCSDIRNLHAYNIAYVVQI